MRIAYHFGPGAYAWLGGHLVRLEERYRQCVVVIGCGKVESEDEISPWGTAFIVGVGDGPAKPIMYLVTAWHVVAQHFDVPFHVRFNKRAGGAKTHLIENPHWIVHPTDNTVDVAVHEITIPDWAHYTFIPKYPNILLDDRMDLKNIGAGNRTYTVGLWKFLSGDRRNQPFVYTGHIGLIPEDQLIPVRPWLREHGGKVQVEAYLVEGEPIDGASGSPVFVRHTIQTATIQPDAQLKAKKVTAWIEGSVWLLGLQSDAFVGVPGEDYEIPRSGQQVVVPRGVNVVVPSMKIVEVLDHPKLVAAREAVEKQHEQDQMPVKLSALPTTADNLQHREDFNRLLGAATRKLPPADQT